MRVQADQISNAPTAPRSAVCDERLRKQMAASVSDLRSLEAIKRLHGVKKTETRG